MLRGIDHPAVPLLLEYKELARLHAAHGWSWLDTGSAAAGSGRSTWSGGVVSGRWATRGGGALQIPRVLRRAVVADPGWVLVVADAAQLEPRVLAALAGDARVRRGGRRPATCTRRWPSAFGGDRAKAKLALLCAMYGGAGGEAGQLLAVLRRRFPRRRTPTWRRRPGRARRAGWSGPGSAGPARRRPAAWRGLDRGGGRAGRG